MNRRDSIDLRSRLNAVRELLNDIDPEGADLTAQLVGESVDEATLRVMQRRHAPAVDLPPWTDQSSEMTYISESEAREQREQERKAAAVASLSELLGIDAAKITKATIEPEGDGTHLIFTAEMYGNVAEIGDLVKVLRQWHCTPLITEDSKP